MPDMISGELLQLRQRVEEFAADVLVPSQRQLAGDRAEIAAVRERVVQGAKAAGLFAMTQPKSHGGSEAGLLPMTVVRDTLAGFNTGLDRWVFGPGPGVLAGCAEPLQSRYLQPLLNGQKRAAFAFTEPADAAHFTRAVPSADGVLVVSGGKSYVSGGADADFLNTLVEIEGQGRALLVIDVATPGVVLERQFNSLDGASHASFRFDSVRVPMDRVIGSAGEGMPRALRQIGDTRLAIAARAVGLARWTVAFTRSHLASPHRSKAPLGDHEGVRLRYADQRINTFAARSMVYRTARLGDAGANIVNEGIACKVFATETVARVVDTAIQLVGGKALVVGHPLERLYREVRALQLAEGASDVLRLNLARGDLDLNLGVL